MRHTFHATFGLALGLAALSPALAQNIEDEPLQDEPIPTAPKTPVSPLIVTPPGVVAPPTPLPPIQNGDTVTVPRAVWEQLIRDVEELKRTRAMTTTAPAATETTSTGSRNYLLLPDISFIADNKALASSDKRDGDRNNLDVEGEIGIQGYIYPNVKYDTFIVANPGEDESFGIEEGFVTFLGAQKGLNIQLGRKFAAFGRNGEQHPHSWPYSRQILARQNLVAGEALVGNGVQFNYLLPTGKKFFARASFGAFGNGEGSEARFNTFDPTDPFDGNDVLAEGSDGFPARPGAGFSRFYTGRLWMGTSLRENTELDFGVSAAKGRTSVDEIIDDGTGTGTPTSQDVAGRVNLRGMDVSLRHFLSGGRRLLMRGEYFRYSPQNLPTVRSTGYYGLLNYRFNKFNDIGLLHEKSDFPTGPGLREKATSLLYTRQFNERYFMRLMGTRGDRPGESRVNELRLQFTAGLGPHTHELE